MWKTAIAIIAVGLVVATAASAAGSVRISQVYGSGGNTYKCDYVELFNNSDSPVDIGGWSVQYGSATGSSFGSSTYNYALIPSGATIPPCGYYLISGYCSGAGADLPVTPDLSIPTSPPLWQFNFSSSAGKVALFNDQVFNRTCDQAKAVAVDIVGYGGTANCYETAPATGLDAASVLVRGGGGAVDTDNNSTDFSKVAQPVTIHNSSSPRNPDCSPVATLPSTWGRLKTIYR